MSQTADRVLAQLDCMTEGELPVSLARYVVHRMLAAGLPVDRAVACPDGDVAIYVFGQRTFEGTERVLHAGVTVGLDSSLAGFLIVVGADQHDEYFGIEDLAPALSRITEFLQPSS